MKMDATGVRMNTATHNPIWTKAMEDKAGAASYAVSSLMALFGLLTLQQWGVIAGIFGILATLGIKTWEARQKVKIEQQAKQASLDADRAKRKYYEQHD